MSGIIIEQGGALSLVEDCGRFGYQRYGMPVSGAMDLLSLQLANILVGNEPNTAAIEATLKGPEILFCQNSVIAVCGANMQPHIDGNAISVYEPVQVKAGQRLGFAGLVNGCRSYIAFSGGVDVPLVMGSRSTYLKTGTGGHKGRALAAGDQLSLGEVINKPIFKKISSSSLPEYKSEQIIRIIPGPEVKRLDFEGIHCLLTSEYRVSSHSDRMGLRLTGEKIKLNAPGHDIISAGISQGTIQLPGSGEPIILMADRQTTGGYARIANVASADLTLVAQLKPGDIIHFQEISMEKAQQEYIKQKEFLSGLMSATVPVKRA
jgi:biotin-dependent carboxylase-like uncharacterized protein